MTRCCLTLLLALMLPTVAQAAPADLPEAEKIRFCERVRDHALLALYDRDRGKPMRLHAEDGSPGLRIVNHVIRRIYEEPQISSPKEAQAFGRGTCNELMGTQSAVN
jgi:hypothetical protein